MIIALPTHKEQTQKKTQCDFLNPNNNAVAQYYGMCPSHLPPGIPKIWICFSTNSIANKISWSHLLKCIDYDDKDDIVLVIISGNYINLESTIEDVSKEYTIEYLFLPDLSNCKFHWNIHNCNQWKKGELSMLGMFMITSWSSSNQK